MILVTGATGNVGSAAVDWLVDRAQPVRAGFRDPSRNRWGASVDPVRFDWTDDSTWNLALAGVDGLVLVRPPAVADVESTLNRFVTAAARCGCRRVAFLSVVGVDRKKWIPHRKVEEHVRRSGLSWTFLRAGFFSQNLLDSYLPDINDGFIKLPAGAGKVAWVDARDLGEAAARVLLDEIWSQRTPVLTGPDSIDFIETCRILSQESGREVAYRSCSAIDYFLHLKFRHSLPAIQCLVQTVLHVGLRSGDAAEVRDDLRLILGRAPRTFSDFVGAHLKQFSPNREGSGLR